MNLTFNDIKNIHKKIRHNVKWTETTFTSSISEKLGIDTFLKLENRQHTGAFKIRGSYSKLLSLSEAEKKAGVVAMSAGNHAQGVAMTCQKLRLQSSIVMPLTTPTIKVNAVRKLGSKVILSGDTYDEAYNFAIKYAKENNYTFVHPYDDLEVIAGQGTIAIELINQLEEQMYKYANQTEFEKAAYCRDKIKELKRKLIEV